MASKGLKLRTSAHLVNRNAELGGKLSLRPVLIQTCHGGEVLTGDAGSVLGADQSVSVGGVADHHDLHRLLGKLVKSFTL